jgi:hypothetical protein
MRCEQSCARCEEYGRECINEALFTCETCGGCEGSLTTHCPGSRPDSLMLTMVMQKTADFRDGEWHFFNVIGQGWRTTT